MLKLLLEMTMFKERQAVVLRVISKQSIIRIKLQHKIILQECQLAE